MSFEEDVIRGKTGEKVVHYALTHSKNIKDVWDVSDDTRYRINDVDFLVQTYNNQVYGVEVKTDFKAHETGNIFFETDSNGNVGCLERTTADYIYYYIYHSKKLYVIITKRLKQLIESGRFYKVKGGENAEGYLIPIERLIELKVAEERRL